MVGDKLPSGRMLRLSIGVLGVAVAAIFGFYVVAQLETNPAITTDSPYYPP